MSASHVFDVACLVFYAANGPSCSTEVVPLGHDGFLLSLSEQSIFILLRPSPGALKMLGSECSQGRRSTSLR